MNRIQIDPSYELILISDELERYALLQIVGDVLGIAIEELPFHIISNPLTQSIVAVIKES